MTSGEGFDEELAGLEPTAEAADAPAHRSRRIDPAVELDWLGRRHTARRDSRLPRLSTLILLGAFVAVLILYLALQPS